MAVPPPTTIERRHRAVIRGTVFIKNQMMTIEPKRDLLEWGIDPDAVANLITALQRNMPDGQYFFDLSVEVEPVPEE